MPETAAGRAQIIDRLFDVFGPDVVLEAEVGAIVDEARALGRAEAREAVIRAYITAAEDDDLFLSLGEVVAAIDNLETPHA